MPDGATFDARVYAGDTLLADGCNGSITTWEVQRTNLANPPRPNPAAQTTPMRALGTAWGDGAGTQTIGGTDANGTVQFACTTTPTSLPAGGDFIGSASTYPVTPGRWYGFTIYIGCGGMRQNLRPALVWIGAGPSLGTTVSVGGMTWLTLVGQAPAGATQVRLDIDYGTGVTPWTVGSYAVVRNLMLIEGDTQSAVQAVLTAGYFDGDYANTDGHRYAWTGDANASTSTDSIPVVTDPPYMLAEELSVSWGRTTTFDQPSPSTCAFTLYDTAQPPAFASDLAIGQRITVRSGLSGSDSGYVEALPDRYMDAYPLDTAPPAWILPSGASARSTRAPYWYPPDSGRKRWNLAPDPADGGDRGSSFSSFWYDKTEGDTYNPRRPGGHSSRYTIATDQHDYADTQSDLIFWQDMGGSGAIEWPTDAPSSGVGLSFWLRASSAYTLNNPALIRMAAYWQGGGLVEQDITTDWKPSTTWTQYATTLELPAAGAKLLWIQVRITATKGAGYYLSKPPAGWYLQVADVGLITLDVEQPAPDKAYFDGDFTDTPERAYSWLGTPWASASLDAPVDSGDPPPLGGPGAPPSIELSGMAAAGKTVLPPGDPAADAATWELLPKTNAADSQAPWSWGVTVQAAKGKGFTVQPVEFTAPGKTYALVGAAKTVTDGGGILQRVTGEYVPSTTGRWVGLAIWPTAASTTLYVDDVTLQAPLDAMAGDLVVFDGRVSDMHTEYIPEAFDASGRVAEGYLKVNVTCQDLLADDENHRIADAPWARSSVATRVDRIEVLRASPVPVVVAADVGAQYVRARDVDSQPAATLLRELAISMDGVLLCRTPASGIPELAILSPNSRPLLGTLNACFIDISAVWDLNVDDIMNTVEVAWTDTAGNGQTKILVDDDSVAAFGHRSVSVQTELDQDARATKLAQALRARTTTDGKDWRISDVRVAAEDVPAEDMATMQVIRALIGSTSRFGYGLRLEGLPGWTPDRQAVSTVYVEGGQYTFAAGYWTFSLTVSSYAGRNVWG